MADHKELTFSLETDFIELIKLLKLVRIASSGAEAKMFVGEGMVCRNKEIETRKRAKLIKGDIIEVEGIRVTII
ncbi:MAG: RNA-binding S4 domain-containing protein [Bacteroidales bacterium]|nr:RNA-binding S4 domain-containing protein [Bacteroidales bacterium]